MLKRLQQETNSCYLKVLTICMQIFRNKVGVNASLWIQIRVAATDRGLMKQVGRTCHPLCAFILPRCDPMAVAWLTLHITKAQSRNNYAIRAHDLQTATLFSSPVVLCQRADKYNLQMLKKSCVASKHDHTCIRLLSFERSSDSTVR